MTAKEKAKELVDRYFQIQDLFKKEAKQCALITVDEILKANAVWYNGSIPYKYWQQVKNEIEKL